MKWLVFVLTLLAVCMLTRAVEAKSPRAVVLSEAEVAPIHAALGYTTMLQFDGRPTSAILGDQDAFKVEYVGNGLAIKPIVPGARTNLFVFTDYDRFSFRLIAGSSGDVDYLVKVKQRRVPSIEESSVPASGSSGTGATKLLERRIRKRATCGDIALRLHSLAWPQSKSALILKFDVERRKSPREQIFEPGDFSIDQAGRSLAIESLNLTGMHFNKSVSAVHGMAILHASDINLSQPLSLQFRPDFLSEKYRTCLRVVFSVGKTKVK